jgi:hypothetical protein
MTPDQREPGAKRPDGLTIYQAARDLQFSMLHQLPVEPQGSWSARFSYRESHIPGQYSRETAYELFTDGIAPYTTTSEKFNPQSGVFETTGIMPMHIPFTHPDYKEIARIRSASIRAGRMPHVIEASSDRRGYEEFRTEALLHLSRSGYAIDTAYIPVGTNAGFATELSDVFKGATTLKIMKGTISVEIPENDVRLSWDARITLNWFRRVISHGSLNGRSPR